MKRPSKPSPAPRATRPRSAPSAEGGAPTPAFPIERAAGAAPPRDPRAERGTVEHYLDPALYDHEYRRRRADVNYYRALAGGRLVPLPGRRAPGAPLDILELGCGTGRLLLPLLRDGHRVTGVDLSRAMLRRCAERVARLPGPVRDRARLVEGDFRALALGRRYPLVVIPFNAMMHLYTRDDLERFLAVVRDHLAPGGIFAFDVMNPDLEWLTRDPMRRWARTRFKDPSDGRTWYYSTNHLYDSATQVNWIRLYYDLAPDDAAPPPAARRPPPRGERSPPPPKLPVGPAGTVGGGQGGAREGGDLTSPAAGTPGPPAPLPPTTKSRVVQLAQRQLFPQELLALLHYNGFAVDAREGGFVGEPFDGASQSQVCRCSIRGAARR